MQVSENIQTAVTFSPLLKRYTLEEFWSLSEPGDRSHYELIEGVLQIVPLPNKPHGKIIANLTEFLVLYNFENNKSGTIYYSREAIYIEETWGTCLALDMMFISTELEEKMGERRTSADIAFECLSESTGVYDRTTKADTYLALGVKEPWLIDSDNQKIEIRDADTQDGVLFWRKRHYVEGAAAESEILENWKVAVSEVFTK